MKHFSPTHVLGLLLAAAASAEAAEYVAVGAFGGSNVAAQGSETLSASASGGSGVPARATEFFSASASGGSNVAVEAPESLSASASGGSNVPAQASKVLSASAGGGSNVAEQVPETLSASASGGSHVAAAHELVKMHVLGSGKDRNVALGPDDVKLLHPMPHYMPGFLQWSQKYGLGWEGVEDTLHALKNYAVADDRIFSHDAKEAGFTIGHNAYSHMSWSEFRNHFSIGKDMVTRGPGHPDFDLRPRGETATASMLRGAALPDEVDWVAKGGVTEVKNQGSCGSCWSFSTTGSMEGAHFIKTGELAVLSEQELVDCDTYDMGCNGGLMDYSFHWIQQNGGICSEADYPYKATGELCTKTACDVVPGTMVDKWIDVANDSEEALMEAVAQQPVSIAIEADEMSFQLYSGGVLTAACGTNLDHGVLLVGYGVSEDGIKYWKVKNSWGPEWGADGYILLKREAAQEGGECGILEQASYPVLA